MDRLRQNTFSLIREGASGLEFEILIIREGKSKNGTYYPKETLLKARELFEGAKVAFYQWQGIYDHLSEEARQAMPHGFPNQICGILKGVKFSKVEDGYGLIATLKLSESHKSIADIFRLGLENDNKEILGFSIDVLGTAEKRQVEGEEVDYVTEIGVVNEVTVVTNPAAGGRLERMVASYNDKKEKQKMKETLFRLIAAVSPKKLDGLSLLEAEEPKVIALAKETITELQKKFQENREIMAALNEIMSALDAGDVKKAKESIQKVIDAYDKMVSGAMDAGHMNSKEVKEGEAEVIDIKKRQEELEKKLTESEKRDSEMRVRLCEATLKAELADSKLPDPSKERITDKFKGKEFAEEELKKEIDSEKKYCARMMEALHPNGLRIEVGQDSTDKMGDAVEGWIAGAPVNKVEPFKNIKEAYCRMTGTSPFQAGLIDRIWEELKNAAPVYNRKRAFREAIATAGLGEVLADRLHKRMVMEYKAYGLDDWRKFTEVVSASDFLNNRAVRLGGYGTNMPTVAEAGTYTALTSPTDEEAAYAVTKRGGLESISLESVRNDNLNVLLRAIPKRLGRSCASTLHQFVFALIDPAVNAAIYDGTTIYHATHGANLRTVALSYAEFNNHAIVLMDQAAYNEANLFLNNPPKYIVVPNELWLTASEIANSNQALSGGRTETVDNQYSAWKLEVIRAAYWTDANNWATIADPSALTGIQVAFLDGNEEPEILQEVANTGSEFTNDQIRLKVRHIYGGAVTDFRPFVGAVVA
jgi:hypothetical protein